MAEETKVETMEDYAAELEASFKKVRTGDNLTGVIIDVTDEKIVVDLKYYAEGIILKEDINADPDYSLKEEYHVGDEITATVVKTDDGEGNILLSLKQAKEESAWEKLERMMEERTVLEVKIAEVVKSGVVAYVDGIRGFIPASKLSDGYVEDLETFNGKTIGVTVITADKEHKNWCSPAARWRDRRGKRRRTRASPSARWALSWRAPWIPSCPTEHLSSWRTAFPVCFTCPASASSASSTPAWCSRRARRSP